MVFIIVNILVISPTIDGSEHTTKSLRGGDLKVPNFLPMIFKSWFELLVAARFVIDLRFMNMCQQPFLPDLKFRVL